MDTAALTKLLDEAVTAGVTRTTSPVHFPENPDFEAVWDSSRVWTAAGVKDRVIAALRGQPELSVFDPGWIRYGWHSGGRIELPQVAEWLLAQALATNPQRAAETFLQFLATNEATVIDAHAVAGLPVDGPTELSAEVEIAPFENLSPSYSRGMIRQLCSNPFGVPRFHSLSVLVTRRQLRPIVTPPPMERGPTPQAEIERATRLSDLISEAIRVLCLVGPRPVTRIGSWQQFASEGVPALVSGGVAHTFDAYSPSQVSYGPFDINDAKEIVRTYLQLSPQFRAQLHVSIDRLNQAMRHREPVEQAIDLGIALEALLLHDVGQAQERGELAHRLSLRGAWLAGQDGTTRGEQFRLLRNLYDLRSKGVHSGKLEQVEPKLRGGNKNTSEVLAEGFRICNRLLRKVITRGAWPDWTLLVLGGGDPVIPSG